MAAFYIISIFPLFWSVFSQALSTDTLPGLPTTDQSGLNFITLGDWGGAALTEGHYSENVAAVAAQMKTTSDKIQAKFVINTGDNFYWCGIENTSDYQVSVDWLKPYDVGEKGGVGDIPWYGVLGNHEYGYNVSAQLALAQIYPTWVMDDRYYSRRVQLDGDNYATFIFLDSSPCISEYRATNPSGWDPCSTEYPTCSISGGHDNFEGDCHFHQNIMTQDCSKQTSWLKSELKKVPKNDWLIVVAHHPADEIDVEDVLSILNTHGFDLYLNGHAHTLTHYSVDGADKFVTSGAGACVDTDDQHNDTPGKNRTFNKVNDIDLDVYQGHKYETVFNQKVAGFTTHAFSSDYTTLTTNFLDYNGKVIHTFTVQKGQLPTAPTHSSTPPTPTLPPTPPTPPTPTACCFYSDHSCSPGQVCCKTSCSDPSTCSYSEAGCSGKYGKIHRCSWSGSQCTVANSTTA